MLSFKSVGPYLLRTGLIEPAQIVDDGLTLRDLSRRNTVFTAKVRNGPAYLVKESVEVGKRTSLLSQEACVLSRLWREPGRPIWSYLPRLHCYDHQRGILVLECFPEALNLRDALIRRGVFSLTCAGALGKALSALHNVQANWIGARTKTVTASSAPWVLFLHRPGLRTLRRISGANLELLKMVQQSEPCCKALDGLAQRWRARCLIHQDLKFDNCLAVAARPGGRRTSVKIVDWELARRGDPCWDVGSLFSEFLYFWVSSIPDVMGQTFTEDLLTMARFPLEKMQPAIKRFWDLYSEHALLSGPEADRYLVSAVRYCAARLLQSTYEHMQESSQLSPTAVCLVQLTANILEYPHEAATHLLGIPIRGLQPTA